MKGNSALTIAMIAPCGMNCGICLAHLRERKPCPGCLASDANKSPHCIHCRIKNCESLKAAASGLCVDCDQFPCARMKQLDKRYRTKYGMSMLENLQVIQSLGMKSFVRRERARWTCPNCGGVICVHRWECLACGEKRKSIA